MIDHIPKPSSWIIPSFDENPLHILTAGDIIIIIIATNIVKKTSIWCNDEKRKPNQQFLNSYRRQICLYSNTKHGDFLRAEHAVKFSDSRWKIISLIFSVRKSPSNLHGARSVEASQQKPPIVRDWETKETVYYSAAFRRLNNGICQGLFANFVGNNSWRPQRRLRDEKSGFMWWFRVQQVLGDGERFSLFTG